MWITSAFLFFFFILCMCCICVMWFPCSILFDVSLSLQEIPLFVYSLFSMSFIFIVFLFWGWCKASRHPCIFHIDPKKNYLSYHLCLSCVFLLGITQGIKIFMSLPCWPNAPFFLCFDLYVSFFYSYEYFGNDDSYKLSMKILL